jgi:predicted metal-dependent hydrolase
MSTETYQFAVSGLKVDVVRKQIKNLHLGVYPPRGRIRVAAPLGLTRDAVRLAVIDKLTWIKRQRAKFEAQPRQSEREFVSGETHYFLGRRYRLRVTERSGRAEVVLNGKHGLTLYVRQRSSPEGRERLLLEWYRAQLKELAGPLLTKWQKTLGVKANSWGVRKMKTKWGSCNPKIGHILINLELAKKPLQCLEYVIVHELVHLLERKHNDRFIALMDKYLPNWRQYRDELNATPLSAECW